MTRRQHLQRLAAAALMAAAAAPLARAASSTSSAVSDSLATSSGSVSDSLKGSSRASSPNNDRRSAVGDYRIVAVSAMPERPGRVQLALQRDGSGADAAASAFALELPQPVLQAAGLALGDVVAARQRPYGVEFAVAATRQPFFLVLDDDWHRELQARPLGS